MLSDNQLVEIRASFPSEALTPDTSRGFELTSIKAAYVIERLNEVFGVCGIGWRYTHSDFEDVQTPDGRREILTEIALQYRLPATEEGYEPVDFHKGWQYRENKPCVWSEPIYAVGGHGLGKGNVPYTDARKSAVTNGLTKAASMIGIGHEVFKGLVHASQKRRGSEGNDQHESSIGIAASSGDTSSPTAFWSLYQRKARPLGITMEQARELTSQNTWDVAYQELNHVITQASAQAQ